MFSKILLSYLIFLQILFSEVLGKVFEYDIQSIELGLITLLEPRNPLPSNYFLLNLEYSFMWKKVKENEFSDRKSEAQEFTNISMYQTPYEAIRVLQNLSFPKESDNDTKISFPMYLIVNDDWFVINSIGLSLGGNKDLNLVYQLKENGLIENRRFGIGNFNGNSGKFYLGDIIPESFFNYTSFKKIFVNKTYDTWGMYLNKVVASGKEIYSERNYSYFQTNQTYISVPFDFIDSLEKTIFSEYIKREECKIIFNNDAMKGFNCVNEVIKNFPSFFFHFDQGTVELSKELLFQRLSMENNIFLIIGELKFEKFVIGNLFLKNFFSVFDYEDSSITFYQSQEYWKVPKNSITIISVLLCVIGVICMTNNIILIVFKFKSKSYEYEE